MEYIIAIGIFQSLAAAVWLSRARLRNSADGILVLLLLCIATHLTIKLVIYNFVGDKEVRLMMNTFINFCYGPLLYLYALKVKDPAFVPSSRWYVFLPFAAGLIGYFSVVSVLFTNTEAGHHMLYWYNTISFWIFIPADFIFSLIALQLARRQAAASAEQKITRQIAWIFLTLSCVALLSYILLQRGFSFNIAVRSIAYAMLVVVCLSIVRHRYILYNNIPLPAADVLPVLKEAVEGIAVPGSTAEDTPADSKKGSLPFPECARIWQQLESEMKDRRLFLDSDLSLDKLSSQSGINKYHISETLNHFARKSFYQYINEYRVADMLARLKDLQEKDIAINILSLAYDAGFKSKSSFNRYFKELTGYTPTEYIRSLKNDNGGHPMLKQTMHFSH